MLESTNEEGLIINGEHIRMRGIPTACIKYYAEQKITLLDMYKKLYEGDAVTFDSSNDFNQICL